MKTERVKLLTPVQRFLYLVTEREVVRTRKMMNLPKPWTDDTILQSYRFCNIRRMDDKVSQWLLEHWYQPYFNHKNMLTAVALARFINQPTTLEKIGFPENWSRAKSGIKRTVRAIQKAGWAAYNGAYMVRGLEGADKIEAVVDWYVDSLVEGNVEIVRKSMEYTHANISNCYGFGSFMAGQVTADLRWAIKGDWADKDTWAPMGPGSKRGMNRLHGRKVKQALSQEQFLGELRALMNRCSGVMAPHLLLKLEAMDFQNCLCEFDKYERVLWGEGRPKQLYPGV